MRFRKLNLDWRYAISELLIVATGVLIALAADGWRQGQADRALERLYLNDLVTDLRSDTAQLSAVVSLAETRAALGHAVLRAMDGDTVLTPTALAVALERQFYFACRRENRLHGIVIALTDRVELVIVASCASNGQPEQTLADRASDFV